MTTPQISRATRRERGQRAVGRGVVCALAVLVPLAWGERLAAATSPVYEHVLSLSESLSAPTAVAVDAADYIYVIESTKGTLLVYDASGVLQRMLSDLRQPIIGLYTKALARFARTRSKSQRRSQKKSIRFELPRRPAVSPNC